jgi:hypothetical protein
VVSGAPFFFAAATISSLSTLSTRGSFAPCSTINGTLIIFEPSTTIGHTDVWVDGEIDNPSLYRPDWYTKVQNDLCSFWDLNS